MWEAAIITDFSCVRSLGLSLSRNPLCESIRIAFVSMRNRKKKWKGFNLNGMYTFQTSLYLSLSSYVCFRVGTCGIWHMQHIILNWFVGFSKFHRHFRVDICHLLVLIWPECSAIRRRTHIYKMVHHLLCWNNQFIHVAFQHKCEKADTFSCCLRKCSFLFSLVFLKFDHLHR